MSSLQQLVEAYTTALVMVRPAESDDIGKLVVALRAIKDASGSSNTGIRSLVERALGELECADVPLSSGTLTALHRLALEMKTAAAAGATPTGVAKVERDADTIAAFGDFLEETDGALAEVDRVLLEAEQAAVTKEGINSLFRAFHTIKGVSGFLDLEEIGRLAHTAETLLDLARDGELAINTAGRDCLLEATEVMRAMMKSIAEGIQHGTPFKSHAQKVDHAIAWLSAVTRGETFAQAAPPPEASEAGAHEEEAEPQAESSGAEGGAKLKSTLKVDVERVDGILEMIGELVLLESMLTHTPELRDVRSARVTGHLSHLAKITRNLQSSAMRMRMVPVRTLFQRLPRIVRETAKKAGKEVEIELVGDATEMDRGMVDRLGEPLVHMIRNSVDHGIESADARARAGKPWMGKVRVSAFYEGSTVIIEVSDDGKGLDREAILRKAREQGLVGASETPPEEDIHQLIFAPGFSTAAKVSEISGRGVGMDVVKRGIEGLRGRILIHTTPGQGTTFRLVLPLTLAIIDATIVRCGEERYVIPSLSMIESLRPSQLMLGTMGGHRELLRFRGAVLPLFRCENLFGVGSAETDLSNRMVVVVDCMNRQVALLVDEVLGQQQVVVKSLDGGLARSESFVGAAILSDGKVALILNVDDLGRLGETFNAQRSESVEGNAA